MDDAARTRDAHVSGAPQLKEGLLTGRHLDEAVEVSVRAFEDDPFFRYLFPDDATRPKGIAVLHRVVLRHVAPLGVTRTAYVDGHVKGVAIWLPPGAWPFPPRVQIRQLLGSFPAFFGSLRTLSRVRPLLKEVVKAHTRRPHWYLQLLMVDPSEQRKGIGAMLQAPELAACDRDGVIAWLETQKVENLAYYARFGFRVEVEHRAEDADVAMWSLIRDPQPPG